ncbi:MAG: cupin domain-containing protein [Solirubrobacteraceae bacterium]
MPLDLPPAQRKVTNKPFKSAGEHNVLMHADGQMTDTTLVFHATADQTNNYCTITEIQWTQEDHAIHHIHLLEDEAFYVVEGAITVHTDRGDIPVGPGEVAWGPRRNRHAYSVHENGARCLLIQVPGTDLTNFFKGSAQLGDALTSPEAVQQWFRWSAEEFGVVFLDPTEYPPGQSVVDGDGAPAPQGGVLDLPELSDVVVNRIFKSSGDRRVRSKFAHDPDNGAEYVFHLSGKQTGGALGLIEIVWGANEAVAAHTHSVEDRAFYVLEGSIDVVMDDAELNLGPHDLGWIPRGTKHAYRIGPNGARVLMSYFPGTSLDRLFEITAPMDGVITDRSNLEQWAAWAEETFGLAFELPAVTEAPEPELAGNQA